MSEKAALFACTRCHTRHPFQELSSSEQLCRKCRTKYPVVKCTYCRAEFQENKSGTNTVCKKCAHNVKIYGKPTACEYCKMMAAFIGAKCQRCANAERKWGLPRNCEQCKLQCAFDPSEDGQKRVDGKTLCWLCTISYKRVLAKARGRDSQSNTPTSDKTGGSGQKKLESNVQTRSTDKDKKGKEKNSDPDWVKAKSTGEPEKKTEKKTEGKKTESEDQKSREKERELSRSDSGASAAKKPRLEKTTSNGLGNTPNKLSNERSSGSDLVSTDNNIIALTQLKEKVESLKKQVAMKDQQMFEKDKKLTELRAEHYEKEKQLITKLTKLQTETQSAMETLQNRDLQRQVVSLTKQASNKKSSSAT